MKEQLLSKGANLLSKMPKGAKIGAGIGGAGIALMGVGSLVGNSADRKQAKADKLERQANAREGISDNLTIAGAIATAGVGGYGISKMISKMR
jgi:hypothetical protein